MGKIAMATMLCFNDDGVLVREDTFPASWKGDYTCFMEKGNVRRFKRVEIITYGNYDPIWIYEEYVA